jgi:hypothetical protein
MNIVTVRVKADNSVETVEHTEAVALMIRAGLLEYVTAKPLNRVAPTANAQWGIGHDGKSVVVYCSACRQGDVIGRPTDKFKFQHCGKSEVIPADLLKASLRKR